MKKTLSILSCTLMGLIILLQPLSAKNGWKKIKDSSGIKLYERPVTGTNLMEYMAVTTIDAKMEVIGEVLRDVPNWYQWQADCKGAQVEKQINRNDMIVYMVMEPPIIDDRDIVLKTKTVYDYDGGKALITFNATDEIKIPIEEGRIRVSIMDGYYDMAYLGREKTKFVYRPRSTPAGESPKKSPMAL
jgi:hypothetical protein